MKLVTATLAGLIASVVFASADAEKPESSDSIFEKLARTLRESALLKIEPRIIAPSGFRSGFNRYPWKRNIVTTIFWIGETPTANNPVPNHKSSWDPDWVDHYGGFDDPNPAHRKNFIPKKFVPGQNPFYVALPYNDVTRGTTKPEARKVIPWFDKAYERRGQSVVKGRWLAIKHGNRICYAQWEDCGPFRTDHWQYVFGSERPRPNLNKGAGLDISPAVRDYLGMSGTDVCDWKFVEARDVPNGPWTRYGDNNTFVLKRRGANLFLVDRNNAYSSKR